MTISLITVYNQPEILKAGILASNAEFLNQVKITLVDNSTGRFSSFAEAVRNGLEQIYDPQEILLITHQDVCFYSTDTIDIILHYIKSISHEDYFFAGAAGKGILRGKEEAPGYNAIVSGGKMLGYQKITKPMPIETLDECVILTNKKTIMDFDLFCDTVCRWHLYAAEACLRLHQQGITPFVLPLSINHLSRGFADHDFFRNGYYLLKKFKMKNIQTTNGNLTKISVLLRSLKLSVKKLLNV